jgi:ribosome-binding protein aMBF1 (putative translation factor)
VVVRVRLARDLARAQRRARWACVSSLLRRRRVEATVITGEQIRRARELLGWTPYRLAPRAGIGHTLLRQFEKGARPIDAESAARLRAALEEAGVEFLGNGTGEGVRLRVCNGAPVEFTDGEPRDPLARNPS